MSWRSRLVPDPIRRRYVLKFGLVLLVMGLAIGAIGMGATTLIAERIEESVLEDQAAIAESEASAVEGWHQQNEIAVGQIATAAPIESGNRTRIERYLSGLPGQLPTEPLAVHYVDTVNGTIVASSRGSLTGASITALNVPQRANIALRSTPEVSWVSKPYLAEDEFGNPRPAVTYARETLVNPNRTVVYTVGLGAFSGSFQTGTRAEALTLVLDGDNQVMLDDTGLGTGRVQNGSRTFGRSYGGYGAVAERNGIVVPGAERIDRRPTGVLAASAYEFPSGAYLVGYAPVDGTDWLVAVHVPLAEAFGFVQTVRWYGTVATLLAILLITGLGSVLGRNTAVAIDRLTEKAGRIEDGDLDVDFETERIDEIGALYGAFGNMRDALGEQIDELTRINRDLEEQRAIISVLNRLLTHNLRNSLSVIVGYSERLLDHLDGELRDDARQINRRAALLSRRIEKSKTVERVVNSDAEDLDRVDVTTVIEETVVEFEREYPGATITTSLPDEQVLAVGEALGFVVENLVENAIEHNDTDSPTVEITIETTDTDAGDWVELHVADDGPGIPDHELEVIERGEETPLQHSSGMGLWLMCWLTEHMGGTLSFSDRDPRGTVATIRLRADPADGSDSGPAGRPEGSPTPEGPDDRAES